MDGGLRHRLMAILSADAAGYTRLMEADEAATLVALDAARAVFRSAVTQHGGRVVDTAGDSVLAVFETARGALDAAVGAQREIESSVFADLPAGRLRFRVGIHLGDVIEKDDGSVYGNGVNIAARLQTLATAGGVSVSEAVRATLGRRAGRVFVDEGMHAVRNIADPVHAFRVRLGALDELLAAGPPPAAIDEVPKAPIPWWRRAAGWPRRAKPWQAVVAVGAVLGAVALGSWLWTGASSTPAAAPPAVRMIAMSIVLAPFTAPAGEAAEAAYAGALRREIAVGLGATARDVTVVEVGAAPEAASAPMGELARRAGVRYVVEGAVRLEAQGHGLDLRLVDSTSGAQAWTAHVSLTSTPGSTEGAIERSRLVSQIAAALQQVEMRRVLPLPVDSLSARELVLRAWSAQAANPTLAGHSEAEGYVERALILDPNDVHALLTQASLLDNRYALDPKADYERIVRQMDEDTARALTIDARDARAWSARALVLVYLGRWNAAADAQQRALEIDPYSAEFVTQRAWLLVVTGRPTEALPIVDQALALKPTNPAMEMRVRCQAELLLGHPEEAIKACETTTALDPSHWIAHLFLVAAYANAGELDKAAAARRAVDQAAPGYTIERLRRYRYSEHPDYLRLVEDHWYAGLRKAGVPER
jgi:adenylate cyclase